MERAFVRLLSLSINNIKNVMNGVIEFDKLKQDDEMSLRNSIMGIYGQNGSGKTAVVDAMYMLQVLLKGKELPSSIYKYIKSGEKEASLKYRFYIDIGDKKYDIEYSFTIRLLEGKRFILSNEKLYGRCCTDGKWENRNCILEYNVDEQNCLFKPDYRNKALLKDMDSFIQAKVAQQFTQGYDEDKRVSSVYSLLFSKKMKSVFEVIESYKEIAELTNILATYAEKDLIVIQNEHFGFIDMNIPKIIFHVNMEEEEEQLVGLLPIDVEEKKTLPKLLFEKFSKVVEQTSNIINALVPDVKLEICNIETKYTKEGEEGISFELVTKEGESIVPFECVSAGIRKLISISTTLQALYNRPSVCLVIDEFDTGIFEYLLGQLLEIMQEYAKGQLIFTSHNLRALEVLENSSLVFTTTDPMERYCNLKYVKNTQNKRLSYMRAIYLGGQDKEFYKKTSQSKIKRAFRKSWR